MKNSDFEAKRFMVYYVMAYRFGFKPEEVDKMDNRMVDALIHISGEIGEEMDSKANRKLV